MLVEFPNGAKIGIQVKSHFDVAEDQFAVKVKAQLAESQYHGIDKWYLLVCAPIDDGKRNYAQRIGHLTNEFSSYKSSYHIVYSPQHCVNILTTGIMSDVEFRSIKKQFHYEKTNWDEILAELQKPVNTVPSSSYLRPTEESLVKPATNADKYLNHIGYDQSDRPEVLEHLNHLQQLLGRLSVKTREFLFTVVSRATKSSGLRDLLLASCQDLENYLNIPNSTIRKEVKILEDLDIASFDDDFESGTWYVAVNKLNPDYNIVREIRDFAKKFGMPLKEILVDLNFTYFDS